LIPHHHRRAYVQQENEVVGYWEVLH